MSIEICGYSVEPSVETICDQNEASKKQCFSYNENEDQLEAVLEVEANQVIRKRRYKIA